MSKFFVYGDSAIDIERIVKIISYQEAGKPEFVKQIVTDDNYLLISRGYTDSLLRFIEKYEKEKREEHNLRMRLLRAIVKEKEGEK